jgi:membrane-associated phospholipid phosphatase
VEPPSESAGGPPTTATVSSWRRRLLRWAAGLAALVVVLGLLVELRFGPLLTVDREISAAVVQRGDGEVVKSLRFATQAGELRLRIVVAVAMAGSLLWARAWRSALLVAAGALLVSPANELLKQVVDRPRPTYEGVEAAADWSYPSGHSAGAAALAAAVVLSLWPWIRRSAWRWLLIAIVALLAVGVGVTRVALGVHYPSDVIAGWSVGLGWVLLVAAALTWRAPRMAP